MKSRSSKSKGRRLVLELRDELLAAFPHLSTEDVVVLPISVGGEDWRLSPAARLCWPFSTECKNRESLNIWKAIRQAKQNSDGRCPAIVFRRNLHEPWLAIPLREALRLLNLINRNSK